MPQLDFWCEDRATFVEHIAHEHALLTDEERGVPEYRKDAAKLLVMRLIFGGRYEAWVTDVLADLRAMQQTKGLTEFRQELTPRVKDLALELADLRTAVFESDQWKAFTDTDRARFVKIGKKKGEEAINRGVFARIAQSIENGILTVIRRWFANDRRRAIALCFDGLVVAADPSRPPPDLRALESVIARETGYVLSVVEKPFFIRVFGSLTYARAN